MFASVSRKEVQEALVRCTKEFGIMNHFVLFNDLHGAQYRKLCSKRQIVCVDFFDWFFVTNH